MHNLFENMNQNIDNNEYYEILNVDKNSTEEDVYSDYENQLQWFLGLVLFFLLFDLKGEGCLFH